MKKLAEIIQFDPIFAHIGLELLGRLGLGVCGGRLVGVRQIQPEYSDKIQYIETCKNGLIWDTKVNVYPPKP